MGLYHGWGHDADRHADFVRGGVGAEDFEAPRYPAKRKSKKRKRYPGCPENGNKHHIYVWTTEFNKDSLFFRFFGFHKYEKSICCGCGKRNGYRRSERYTKMNEKFIKKIRPRYAKYYSFEDSHEAYRAYRDNYIKRHGFTAVVYDFPWH